MNWKSIIFLSLVISLGSCGKKNSEKTYPDGNGEGANPVKRPIGKTIGAAVTKQIGPEGGELRSANGMLVLKVPPGAVNAKTDFSIQPVENTLEGSPGKAFRLSPEGVVFAAPVTISYMVIPEELNETIPNALYLAYQNKEGYHFLATNTELDPATNTLSVQTTHFSDWTIAELLELEVDTKQVAPGGKANLRLMWGLGSLLGPFTEDQPIGNLVEYNGYVSQVKWSLTGGQGNIQPDGIRCAYQAPGKLPAENPAFVSVSVPFSLYNGKRKGLAMLTAPIYTMPDEYMIISVDGQPAITKAPVNDQKWLNMETDKFYIQATFEDEHSLYLLIPGGITGTGTYPYGDDEKKAYIDYSTDEEFDNSYVTEKYDCPTCDVVYSGGQVKITKFGNPGEYVEGEFTGELWQMGHYSPPKRNITGKFRIKREL